MAKIIPLFSGSKGNSYYVGSSGNGVLIDAGRTCKQLEQAMLTNNMDIKSIKAIFITHEHSDHCKGVKVFAARYNLPVYASNGTLQGLEYSNNIDERVTTNIIESTVVIGDILIKRINTSHDTVESCCFSITLQDGRKAVIATDLGKLSDDLRQEINTANLALIESNHDINMLKNGIYPYHLKRRILSEKGHLSNDSCAEELASFINNGCNRIILGHLSQENNTPDLAFQTSVCQLHSYNMRLNSDYTLDVASPEMKEFSVVF